MPGICVVGDKGTGKTTYIEMLYLATAIKNGIIDPLHDDFLWTSKDDSFKYEISTVRQEENYYKPPKNYFMNNGKLHKQNIDKKTWSWDNMVDKFKYEGYTNPTIANQFATVKFKLSRKEKKDFSIETVDVSGDICATVLQNKDCWDDIDKDKFMIHYMFKLEHERFNYDVLEEKIKGEIKQIKDLSEKKEYREQLRELEEKRQTIVKHQKALEEQDVSRQSIYYAASSFRDSIAHADTILLLVSYQKRKELQRVIDNHLISSTYRYCCKNEKKMILGVTQMDVYEKKYKSSIENYRDPIKSKYFLFLHRDESRRDEFISGKMAYSPFLGELLSKQGETGQASIPVFLFYSAKEKKRNEPQLDKGKPICNGIIGPLRYYIDDTISRER